jgi:hypothetical protein
MDGVRLDQMDGVRVGNMGFNADELKQWLARALKIVLVLWFVVISYNFAAKRVGVFYNRYVDVIDDMRHARDDCAGVCARDEIRHAGTDIRRACERACELEHSDMSPTIEGLIAVADATYLCGNSPCMETFGFLQLVGTVALFLAARYTFEYSDRILHSVWLGGHKHKAA